MMTSPAIEETLTEFDRQGYAIVRGAVPPGTVKALREAADRALDDPKLAGTPWITNVYGTPVLRNTQSLDPLFANFVATEPFVSLAEGVLGKDFAFCAQNVIRSRGGEAISRWHVDDVLEFPLPPEIPHHDYRMRMPVTWFSFQIALSDIDCTEDGATQVVPGSHYSGRQPPRNREVADEDDPPVWEGRKPVAVLCKAGDVFLFNHQLWHRGGLNTTGKMRYLMQNQYCARWVDRRFGRGPHRECELPPELLAQVTPEARRILRLT